MRLFLLLVLAGIMNTAAISQDTTSFQDIEVYGRYTFNGDFQPNINIYGEKKLFSKINLTYTGIVESEWSEFLIGLNFLLAKGMSVGICAGIEHNPSIYRVGGSVWLGHGKTSLLMLGEKGFGNDNYWYKTILSYKISDNLTAGAMAWRYHGIGPLVKYTPIKSNFTVWVFPAYDHEAQVKRIVLGLSYKI